MSGDLIIDTGVERKLPVLSEETLSSIAESIKTLAAVQAIPDAEAIEAHSVGLGIAAKLSKDLNAQRLDLTRPLDAAKKKIKEMVDEALAPLISEKNRVAGLIAATQTRLEEARRAEEARLRKEQEEREAAARKAAQEERERRQREADEEAAVMGTQAEEVQEIPVAVEMPVAAAKPKPKTAVQTRTKKELDIQDPDAIPREIAGAVLMVPEKKTIKRLLTSGIKVPGCRLVEVPVVAVRAPF